MLIFKEKEEISIRALVWKLQDGRTYMDRIYANKDSDLLFFVNYAKENGWLYYNNITRENYISLRVQINDINYQMFPYMDTFKFLDIDSKILSSNGVVDNYELESQEGGYAIKRYI